MRSVDLLTFRAYKAENRAAGHIVIPPLYRHVVGRPLVGLPPPLVVDLRGSDMAVPEQFLDLADIDAGIEEQRRRRRPERVRRVDAAHQRGSIRATRFRERPGQPD